MRSKLITVVTAVASVLLVAQVAAADQVQEQLRLMEQRMAEMEDRLQATSDELRTAQSTVNEQKSILTSSGLIEQEEDDSSLRSGAAEFFQQVDVDGVAAASYNYRFIDQGDNDGLGDTTGIGSTTANGGATNDSYFTHRNADTFQLDQLWLTLDKTPTDESRGGFHVDFVWGETAASQGDSSNRDAGLLYTGYASYLAPIGNGVQIDAGKLATPLGAEVLKANQNFNVTNGVVFQTLQPFTHTGVSATTEIAPGMALIVGVVNEVYRDTNISVDRSKAGYAQIQFSGDNYGLNIGAIVGQDPTSTRCDSSQTDCNTSVFDITATVSPADNVEAWINFDWVRNFGDDVNDGSAYGIAGATRVGISDSTSVAGRAEYMRQGSNTLSAGSKDRQIVTVTGTLDQELTDGLHVRGELRWDRELEKDAMEYASGSDDQLTGILEMYYEF